MSVTREDVKLWRKSTASFSSLAAVKACYSTLCTQFLTLLDEKARVEEEVQNLRLRIKAVDQEHEQLKIDRVNMVKPYEALESQLAALQAENARLRNELQEAGAMIKRLAPLGEVTKEDIIWAQQQLEESNNADRRGY